MRFAQILNQKVHWIFEAEEMPNFPPTPTGELVVIIDITNKPDVQEGWNYNEETKEFTEPIVLEPEPKPTPKPTEDELFRAEVLLAQQEIKITQQSQDAVLAEILLSQQTV